MPAYKDAKKGTWYVKFRYKNWTDDTRNVTKRGFKTKREAVEWERKFLEQKAGNPDMSFGDFVEVYLNDRSPRIRESTTAKKKHIIETKILPYFKKKVLRDITSTDVIQWQNELLKYRNSKGKPYSKSYLKEIHSQLTALFNHAVRFYSLRDNPARIAGNMGHEKEIHMKFWTKDEYLKFAEVMMDDPLAYYCFEMLYWCGIREGELLALTPADFNFNTKTVSITKTFYHLNGKDIIAPPKTAKSRRTIAMPDTLCEEIKDFLAMNYEISAEDRLFPVTKFFLSRKMEAGSALAGVPRIRIHDLRHSHVSLLINMGYDAVAIADRLGHESIHITYRYAHLFPTVQAGMANQLNTLMEGANHVS